MTTLSKELPEKEGALVAPGLGEFRFSPCSAIKILPRVGIIAGQVSI
jgi:hypothetical protein